MRGAQTVRQLLAQLPVSQTLPALAPTLYFQPGMGLSRVSRLLAVGEG